MNDAVCSALGCPARSNDPKKKNGRTFHRFPLDPIKRQMWESAVKRKNWVSHKYSFLCSDHFEEGCFIRNPTYVSLKEDAVPTIFQRSKRWNITIPLGSSNSTLSLSDDEFVEHNTQPECQNLELLSKVCTLVQPLDVNIRQHYPNNELLKMITLLKSRINNLESKLKAYECKLRSYRKRVKKLERINVSSEELNL